MWDAENFLSLQKHACRKMQGKCRGKNVSGVSGVSGQKKTLSACNLINYQCYDYFIYSNIAPPCQKKNVETLATLKHFSYLCGVILNPIKYWRLKRLCREHARKYNMQYEFDLACGMFGDPIEALEEWDLLNDEIIMKIQAEYNSLIDIELPPPHEEAAQQ